MAVSESNMAEFKMAAIIKLSQNEQVNFFVQNGCIQDSRIQVGCNYEIELEWTSEFFLCKMAESKMAEFKMAAIINLGENYMSEVYFCANDWIQDGRIQDGCHHQVKWEWMSLGQIELVWVIVRME